MLFKNKYARTLLCLENKPTPSITRRPDAKKLYMEEPVSFECKVEISSGWSYEWYKNGTSILNNQSLNMNNLSWSNSGTYKCVAKRTETNFTTKFSEERTLPLSGEPKKATFYYCDLRYFGTDWTYAWYRDGNKVQDYYSKNDRNFSITSASASDRGRYSCSGKLKSRNVYSKKSAELVLVVYGEICFFFFFLKILTYVSVLQLLLLIIFNPQVKNPKSHWCRIPSTI
uniref:Ig-like domain-containing protein n=1 Tax=Amphilophus citrinellus TaxID=61819 RepID=A0A3Q0QUA3_AMPCI